MVVKSYIKELLAWTNHIINKCLKKVLQKNAFNKVRIIIIVIVVRIIIIMVDNKSYSI